MNRTNTTLWMTGLLTGVLLLSACGPATPKTPAVSPDEIITQAAATAAVQLTKIAALTPSPLPPTPAPSNTPIPATPTTAAPAVPPPDAATATATSAPASVKAPDAASFVADVTVPDGTGAAPGSQFEKIWRIKNTGTTTWTVSYSLVWVDGEKMGAPDSIAMPNEVRPGETVELKVKLTAPEKSGSYQTFFRLRNASGQFFRLDGTGDLWVKIAVGGASPTPDLTMTAGAPIATPSVTPTK